MEVTRNTCRDIPLLIYCLVRGTMIFPVLTVHVSVMGGCGRQGDGINGLRYRDESMNYLQYMWEARIWGDGSCVTYRIVPE